MVSKNVMKGSALFSMLLAVILNIRQATIRPYNEKEATINANLQSPVPHIMILNGF